jgi:hypothetical protein
MFKTLIIGLSMLLLNVIAVRANAVNTHTVHVMSVCGMAKDIRTTYECLDSVSGVIEQLLSRMMVSNGLMDNGIRIEDSPFIDMPVTALDKYQRVIIFVNGERINAKNGPSWYISAVLAHELAHFYNGDIYKKDPINIDRELKADYYSGFWMHRNGCTDIESVYAPLINIPADAEHPDKEKRKEAILNGWNAEKIPFNLKGDHVSAEIKTQAELLFPYADLFITITPYVLTRWFLRKRNVCRVKVHLTSKNIRVPTDSILNKVRKVYYIADSAHFKRPLMIADNRNKDGFGYLFTGVWEEFPVKCVIDLKDGSALLIIKRFKLTSQKNN